LKSYCRKKIYEMNHVLMLCYSFSYIKRKFKLLKIVVTFRKTTAEMKRCNSSKIFLLNTMCENVLNVSVMLSTARELVNSVHDFFQNISICFQETNTRRCVPTACQILRYEVLLHNKTSHVTLLLCRPSHNTLEQTPICHLHCVSCRSFFLSLL
jgi:hypothetical protein